MQVFVDRAREVGTTLNFADQEYFKDIPPGLQGEWQKRNTRTAQVTIYKLAEWGFDLSQEQIREGIKNTVDNTGRTGYYKQGGVGQRGP